MSENALMPALMNWCLEQQPAAQSLNLVSGDASFRRYFRLQTPEGPLMAVSAPPKHEDNHAFVSIRQLLADHGVPVPELHGWEQEQGFMLLQDFGDQLLLPALNAGSANQLYDKALHLLHLIQTVPADGLLEYGPRLKIELEVMDEWFTRMLGITLDANDQSILQRVGATLVDNANEQPQVFVHRDFHARNLMLLDDDSLAVIDFQDAIRGAITYDLVSLLRDCYIEWPDEKVRSWALAFRDKSLPEIDDDCFMRWFDLMGLQRHIKVLGVFARLSLRDNKHGYLDDLPLVVRYVRKIAQRYEDTREFANWFEQTLMPEIEKQAWFKP